MISSTAIGKDFFKSQEGYIPLPHWANFYFDLDARLSTIDVDKHFIVALAVPTREYVAPFLAAGINFGRSFIPYDEKTQQEYINFMLSQQIDTPVSYRDKKRKNIGMIDGFSVYEGQKHIAVKFKNGMTIWVPHKSGQDKFQGFCSSSFGGQ